MNSKVEKIYDFGKDGYNRHTTVIKSSNGNIMVGGHDNKLLILDKDLNKKT